MADGVARPVDRIIGGYLLLSAVALAFPHRPAVWPLLLAAHLLAAGALLTGRVARARDAGIAFGPDGSPTLTGKLATFVADWYPFLLLPFLYWEVSILNEAIWGGHYFDLTVQDWEAAVFGGQPAVTMARAWPSLWVSEPLHLMYLTYFPILYVFPAVVYVTRSPEAFHDTLFAMMLGFTAHYLVYIVFPVKGPYFLFQAPGEPVASGPMYQTVHWVLGFGASAGTALPSSHVALSTIQTRSAARHLPGAAPLIGVCTLGIAVGAVYAGIHYAIDIVVGFGTGLALAVASARVRRALGTGYVT